MRKYRMKLRILSFISIIILLICCSCEDSNIAKSIEKDYNKITFNCGNEINIEITDDGFDPRGLVSDPFLKSWGDSFLLKIDIITQPVNVSADLFTNQIEMFVTYTGVDTNVMIINLLTENIISIKYLEEFPYDVDELLFKSELTYNISDELGQELFRFSNILLRISNGI